MRTSETRWIKHFDFIILDILIIEIMYASANIWRNGQRALHNSLYQNTMLFILFIGIMLDVLFPFLRDVLKRSVGKELQMCALYSTGVVAALAIYQFLLKAGERYSRSMFLVFWAGSILVIFVVHLLYRWILKKFVIKKEKLPKLLLITERERVARTVQQLNEQDVNSFKLEGICLTDREEAGQEWISAAKSMTGVDILDTVTIPDNTDTIFAFIQNRVIDDVLIDIHEISLAEKLVQEMMNMGLNVHICLSRTFGKMPNQSIGEIAGRPVVSSSVQPVSALQMAVKRLMDILGGLIGLAITGVLYLIFAPQIKKQSPGPAFYSQIRVGKNGRRFRMYKFRSMYPDADKRKAELMAQNKMDGFMFKMDDDPRIFPVGRFIRKYSIDEFPQFWNVLKGDMSLVGTRPPTEDEWEQYDPRHRARMSMKPGITGLWQVSGRSDITDFEEVVALDVSYIRTWSIWNDIRILGKTISVVLTGKGSE